MKKLFAIALVACHSSNEASQTTVAPSATPSASASVVAAPQDAGDQRRAVVDAWNAAHDEHAAGALDSLYADEVLFYQTRLSRGQCIATKKALFARNPDFKQTLRDVRFDNDRASFVKTVTIGGKSKDYPSYLDLAPRGAGWAITAESDEITDKNLAAKRCTAIAWGKDVPNDAANVELTGRVSRADAPNATMEMEHYFRLTLDKPACLPPGLDLPETLTVHVYGDGAGDPKAYVGKHVRAKGDVFVQHTAHHHEPIVMTASSFTVLP